MFVCMYVQLRISPPSIKLAAQILKGVNRHPSRESPIVVKFAPPEAKNQTANRPVCSLNCKQNWKEPSLACRPRPIEVRATFYL